MEFGQSNTIQRMNAVKPSIYDYAGFLAGYYTLLHGISSQQRRLPAVMGSLKARGFCKNTIEKYYKNTIESP